ncbi:MAG: DegQ family serine endoprotease [Gammaproteobacteria bacterium]|nr:DegQ family serine endoprotease [Gammaproteobacteria bacterium]
MHMKVSITLLGSLLFLTTLFSQHAVARSLPDFTELAKDNSPAVVNISTRQNGKTMRQLRKHFQMPDIPEDSPFHDFFRRFFDEGLPQMPEHEAQSLGSGFIISEDGYILTNHHVVEGADKIEVRLSDRRFFEAEIVGSDKGSDVALIKIEAENLPTAKVGKSNDLEVGEWVLAIGSPFGFDHTVTAGIVSAKGRNLPSENYVPFIQTDVAINPGNSGGPLFNLDGEVVGINSQIYSRTGGFMGLSFAIPIELAMNVAEQIRDTGSVSRGYLGVLIQDVDRDLAESFGLDQPRGALVSQVLPDTPAEKAGLQAGDIIVSFNGRQIHSSSELPPIVGASRVEEDANLEIIRDGKNKELKIRVAQLPKEKLSSTAETPKPSTPDVVEKLGLTVTDVTPAARKRSRLATGGALVTRVAPGAGQRAGFQRGDVVKMFDRKTVEGADHLRELIETASDKSTVAVLVLREDKPLFIALRMND